MWYTRCLWKRYMLCVFCTCALWYACMYAYVSCFGFCVFVCVFRICPCSLIHSFYFNCNLNCRIHVEWMWYHHRLFVFTSPKTFISLYCTSCMVCVCVLGSSKEVSCRSLILQMKKGEEEIVSTKIFCITISEVKMFIFCMKVLPYSYARCYAICTQNPINECFCLFPFYVSLVAWKSKQQWQSLWKMTFTCLACNQARRFNSFPSENVHIHQIKYFFLFFSGEILCSLFSLLRLFSLVALHFPFYHGGIGMMHSDKRPHIFKALNNFRNLFHMSPESRPASEKNCW